MFINRKLGVSAQLRKLLLLVSPGNGGQASPCIEDHILEDVELVLTKVKMI